MKLTDAQIKNYGAYARNPDNWIFASKRNLAIANLLINKLYEFRSSEGNNLYESSGCYYAGYFHAGLAVENALKAVLISRDPSIVSNGKLEVKKFGSRLGHALLNPVKKIIGKLTKKETSYLKKLEEFTWAGRYSVPTKPDSLYDEEKMASARLSFSGESEILNSLIERLLDGVKKQ
jgi:hypothetical protein